ncbi:MAG TPA: VIT1/CCC1 transporter family protein [Woeseiaceae bacterium]|nr:VIT1/CCC1 transporter family protein [Woeseiaceae bacterium]
MSAEAAGKSSRRALDPMDRLSEVLFGLIMVLTFTCSLSVAEVGREDVKLMLIGALGCNLAWGLIDGWFYLMSCLAEKSQNLMTYLAVRKTGDAQSAQKLIAGALPPLVASVLTPQELESMRQRLLKLPDPPSRARLGLEDWRGAFAAFLLVFLSTFPVAIPFLVFEEIFTAMRVSNAVAIVLLFVVGYAFGKLTGRHPWGVGIGMVVIGSFVVAGTMALGG